VKLNNYKKEYDVTIFFYKFSIYEQLHDALICRLISKTRCHIYNKNWNV